MQIHIKKRFYVFLSFLLFMVGGFIWFAWPDRSNVESPSTNVLAADTYSDLHTLIETKGDSSQAKNGITSYEPVTISHTVKEGETIDSIADTYHADSQTIVDYPYNKVGENLDVTPGQILIIPNGYIDSSPPEVPIAIGSGLFSWPANGRISQYAFWWHPGAVDIAAEFGRPVVAAYPGKVKIVEKLNTGYGWHVVLEHSGGYTTLYGHMSRLDVVVGQRVERGEKLGLVGSTGRSTGPHLHFEVRKLGNPVDPMTLLPAR